MLLPLTVLQLPEGAGLARNLADLTLILLLLVLLATFLLVSRVGGDTQLKVNGLGNWEYAPSKKKEDVEVRTNQVKHRHINRIDV